MVNIETYKFDTNVVQTLEKTKFGNKWPIVYIINNNTEAYIGETINAYKRASQHLDNPKRKTLNLINIISSEKFNKSVILDLESFLIQYMAADKKYRLQNGNGGLQNHNYYQREMYEKEFNNIWKKLKERGIVQNDLLVIKNSDLFKYSPYKSLTDDQYAIVTDILKRLADDVKVGNETSFIIHGGAGTGKTIVGIYLIKLLVEVKKNYVDIEEESVDESVSKILKIHDSMKQLKIGLVIPMENLRKTLKKVFKNIDGLNPNMVLSPNDVAKSEEKYDLLIVDEAHRLRKRKNLTQYASFDQNNKKFNLGKDGTELDWIQLQSRYQIFLYDEEQTIKPTDINKQDFIDLEKEEKTHRYDLKTQMRCLLGGDQYIKYVKSLFSNLPPAKKLNFSQYDFKIFDDVNEMVENIKEKNNTYGLCRNIAGYAWKWNSKGKKLPLNPNKNSKYGVFDIEIDGHKYIWNSQTTDWINSKNSINEIGSIHTTQGFDLNYTGLIIGNELKYDEEKQKIYVDKKEYQDAKGKADATEDELLNYVLNIYATMCTRGMRGTYLYVCDEKLRNHFKKYIDTYCNQEEITYEVGKASEVYLKVAEDEEEYK